MTHKKLVLLTISIFYFFLVSGKVNNTKSTFIKKGETTLTIDDIKNGVLLDGEWQFYWKQLLTPEDFNTKEIKPTYYDFPSAWNGKVIHGEKIKGNGYATFRLLIDVKKTQRLLALKIGNCDTSYKLWLNGELFSENGIVGDSPENTTPQWLPIVKGFYHHTDSIELVLQVANFSHRKGGFGKSILLGTFEDVSSRRELEVGVSLLLFGVLLLIGLFFIGMHIFWRKDTSLLYFALFCITISYRFIGTGNYVFIKIFPHIPWELAVKFEYISLFLGVQSIALFIEETFPEASSRLIFNIFKCITAFSIIVTLCFKTIVFSNLMNPYLAVIFIYIIYASFVFVKGYKQKSDGAFFAILSMLVSFLVAGITIFSHVGFIPEVPFVFGIGIILFVFSQSLLLSYRFAQSFHLMDRLREESFSQKMDIEAQNKVLNQLNKEIFNQKDEIEDINKALNEKNDQMMSSIRYAQSIQSVILPNTKLIKKYFPDSFIYNQPRDYVSGDFPWFLQKGDDLYIAAVDCTGHGVPGAFISLIGYFILNDIVNSSGSYEVGEILDKLNIGVTHTLRKGANAIKGDGMDIALAHVNLNEGYVEYAGAGRPLYFVRNKELTTIKGDKYPIGGYYENRVNFHTAYLDIQKGDMLVLFSDGLPDQFGGERQRKFSPRRMRQLITDNHDQPMFKLKEIFINSLQEWKGNANQTDDILVIGIRL